MYLCIAVYTVWWCTECGIEQYRIRTCKESINRGGHEGKVEKECMQQPLLLVQGFKFCTTHPSLLPRALGCVTDS